MTKGDNNQVADGKIIDFIDGKLRSDNELEQIRQNFERTLIEEYGFDKDDVTVDFRLRVQDGASTVARKIALAILRSGAKEKNQDDISILIQVAKPATQPADTKNGASELEKCLMACPNAEFACWTNGVETIYFEKKRRKFDTDIVPVNDFPRKGEDSSSIFTTDRSRLRVATGNNLLNAFKRCHDFIHANQGGSKEQIFWEFLKILFAKIEDEQHEGRPRFAIRNSDERNTTAGQKEVKDRVEALFREVCQRKEFRPLFTDTTTGILFNADVVTYIVAQLEKYDFLHSSVDVKGVAYETIVGPTLEGTKGEFFTPRNVVKMVVKMLDPKPGQRILDPACGTGGFLVVAFNYVSEKLRRGARKTWANPDIPTPDEERTLFAAIHEASKSIFGIDFNSNLVKTAQMNMVMNNDGRGGLFAINSLWKPTNWPVKEAYHSIELSSMDFVMANPPFGTRIKVEGQDILEQFDLAHMWTKHGGKWLMEGTLRTAMPPEVLFIERCVQFLKPGVGKLGIVVPDGILGNPDYEYIRYWILANCQVLASVDLPVETFLPRTGTQTSVLLLRRKSDQEKLAESLAGETPNYEVFMAIAKKVGKDRRGNFIYLRDGDGRPIIQRHLYERYRLSSVLDFLPIVETSGRIVDDHLPRIADAFLERGRAGAKRLA
ncbi:MAG: N-6 DNA methylase [Gemmatimonadota bacterium]|nr:N-6 DNA methylase [Gemmatimonadota bacterium]